MINGEGHFFERIVCESNEQWLEVRKQGIGGSDVAAIVGVSKYKAPYALWAEKTGISEPEDISEKPAVHWGNVLEPVVGEEYRRLHPEHTVRRVNAICRSKERPWAQASLDYEVYQPEKGWGILEIKTAGLRVASDWDEGVPLYYQTQIMHYMAVTGRSYAVVAVLIGGSDYREFTIERDEDDIATINGMVDAFWHENVLKGTAPAATGARSDSAALLQANPKETDEFLELPEEEVSISEYYRFKHERDTAQESMDAIQNQLKQAIGDNKGLETGKYKVTWVRGNAKTFDKKAMKAKYPDIYQEFEGESLRDGGLRFTERKPHDGGSKKRS